MIKPRVSAIIWGFGIWVAAISFFMLSGADLLLASEKGGFFLLWIGLEVITALPSMLESFFLFVFIPLLMLD